MSNTYIKSFQKLLKAVDYPAASTFDEENLTQLFLNLDNPNKEALFKWILAHFDTTLESYAISEEKLRYLLLRTGLVDSNVVCASFLSGLLPHDEQLDLWKSILTVVYYHKKSQDTSRNNASKPMDSPNQTERVSSKSKVQINLLPPEYQKDFEEQTKGNYKDYIERMKEKLLEGEEDEIEQTDACSSLEESIQKVLDLSTSPPISTSTRVDMDSVSKFCFNYKTSLKPHLCRVFDEASNQDVVKLPHLGHVLQEYAFLAKVLDSFKAFAATTELSSEVNFH